jgi:CBS domain-containing protein
MAIEIVHLSDVVKRPLVESSGDRLGKVEDLIVRLGESPHPPIVGAVVRIGGRDLFVPIRKIADLGAKRMRFDGRRVDLRRFERRPGELLLARDLLRRHFINMVGGRLIRANEIELANVDGRWEVVGVDPTTRTPFRRLFPRSRRRAETIVDWETIEPFVAHVPTARLRIPYRKLARLHPAQIADLVEAASHQEGEEIIEAVAANRELEADVFEELDPEHQVEFLESRSDDQAARVLGGMAPDDAADLIMEIDQERRLPILGLLPHPQQEKVRSLLSYNPETAGGLMSPDFVKLSADTTVQEALEAVRKSRAPHEALTVVFVFDDETDTLNSASLVSLVQAAPLAPLRSVMKIGPAHVHPNWDVHATLRKMSDYNLSVVPVLDPDHHELLGVVTVDDLLELLLPTGWRRDYGPAAAEA